MAERAAEGIDAAAAEHAPLATTRVCTGSPTDGESGDSSSDVQLHARATGRAPRPSAEWMPAAARDEGKYEASSAGRRALRVLIAASAAADVAAMGV